MERAIHKPASAPALHLACDTCTTRKVHLSQIRVSDGAKASIGMAVKEMAAAVGVQPEVLARLIGGEIWWQVDTDALTFVLRVEEARADMFVEIPSGEWSFRERSARLH